MITLYTWTTPNGRKIPILLEELGWEYKIVPVDIGKDEQFKPAFLKISPNNKIPAIVDDEAEGGPLSLFESGAVLTYLADKAGKFLAQSGKARYQALQWLNWQIGGFGPMLGQLAHFGVHAKEKIPYAIDRYTKEADRLFGVLDRQLMAHRFAGGDEYGIADMATYPWAATVQGPLKDYLAPIIEKNQAVQRWMAEVGERPAVKKGMQVPNVESGEAKPDQQAASKAQAEPKRKQA